MDHTYSRRRALRTIGAGALGGLALASASVTANEKGRDYGNGGGVGAFLNEEAEWKVSPVWNDGISDATGAAAVEVTVGALTSVDVPEDEFPVSPPPAGPFAFDPVAVLVSPGTEVTWTWAAEHHSVTSYNPDADDPDDPTTTGDHGHRFDEHATPPHAFSHTFEEPGTHLYFCHPHGTPYPAYDHFLDTIGLDPIRENLFGMRGAVIVAGE